MGAVPAPPPPPPLCPQPLQQPQTTAEGGAERGKAPSWVLDPRGPLLKWASVSGPPLLGWAEPRERLRPWARPGHRHAAHVASEADPIPKQTLWASVSPSHQTTQVPGHANSPQPPPPPPRHALHTSAPPQPRPALGPLPARAQTGSEESGGSSPSTSPSQPSGDRRGAGSGGHQLRNIPMKINVFTGSTETARTSPSNTPPARGHLSSLLAPKLPLRRAERKTLKRDTWAMHSYARQGMIRK